MVLHLWRDCRCSVRWGGRRETTTTATTDGLRIETYPQAMRPADEAFAHLQFHLRYDVPHWAFLARLFQKTGPAFVQAWVAREPTGRYARWAAFLYEWLTAQMLEPPARLGGNYVDAVDGDKVVVASPERARKVPRWRVTDNLAGTRAFCPTVVKTAEVQAGAAVDVPQLFSALTGEFGADLLQRAAVWMTLRESNASFAIEGERLDRVQRFADVMARRTGQGEVLLSDAALAELQKEILGERTTIAHFGVRQSPVFVG